ncbi:hypothetical protein C8Q77DRAFT_576037 [Trametes polyzona]|nr:hypothetical protein C8Q77DRAFT_576037 [Trametes polyzona]
MLIVSLLQDKRQFAFLIEDETSSYLTRLVVASCAVCIGQIYAAHPGVLTATEQQLRSPGDQLVTSAHLAVLHIRGASSCHPCPPGPPNMGGECLCGFSCYICSWFRTRRCSRWNRVRSRIRRERRRCERICDRTSTVFIVGSVDGWSAGSYSRTAYRRGLGGKTQVTRESLLVRAVGGALLLNTVDDRLTQPHGDSPEAVEGRGRTRFRANRHDRGAHQ